MALTLGTGFALPLAPLPSQRSQTSQPKFRELVAVTP